MRSADELRIRALINKQKTIALNSLELRELLRLRDKIKQAAEEAKKNRIIQNSGGSSSVRKV